MNRMSSKAERFVVIASFPPTQGVGAKEAAPTKAYSFAPDATISQIFQAIWPKGDYDQAFFTPPSKLELIPDETTIPEAPANPFNELLGAASSTEKK